MFLSRPSSSRDDQIRVESDSLFIVAFVVVQARNNDGKLESEGIKDAGPMPPPIISIRSQIVNAD